MSQSIDVRMLDALEIFHYSYRFQNRLFIMVLEESLDLRNIITDLRVLHSAHIQTIVICHDHDKLLNLLQVWNNRGCPFQYVSNAFGKTTAEQNAITVKGILEKGSIPVFALPDSKNEEMD